MLDSRPLHRLSSLTKGPEDYWIKTAVANYLYSKKHGYRFIHAAITVPPGWVSLALKPFVLQHLAEWQHKKFPEGECTWSLFLDSDAVIRDVEQPLSSLVEEASKQMGPDVLDSVVAAVELEVGVSEANLNSGVMLFDYANGESFFKGWGGELLRRKKLHTSWPFDQGALEGFLGVKSRDVGQVGVRHVKNTEDNSHVKVGILKPFTMNEPDGRFVKHLWGGPGIEQRDFVFDNMLSTLGVSTTDDFNAVVNKMMNDTAVTSLTVTLPEGGVEVRVQTL